MWIKWSLVVVPIVLLLFLAQSVAWVPNTGAASKNAARRERLVFYMGANPEDMNPWKSTATTDSTISDFLFEGLVHYNHLYEIEPNAAHSVAVMEEIVTLVPSDITQEAFETHLKAEFGTDFKSLKVEEQGQAVHFDAGSGKPLPQAPKDGPPHITVPAMKQVRITFAPELKRGDITSAVQAEFDSRMEKRLGRSLYAEVSAAELTKRALAALPESERTKEKEAALNKEFEKWAGSLTTLQHFPIVDFHLRKGVYWTDGPFFDPKLRAGKAKFDPDTGKGDWFGEENGPFWLRGPEMTSRDCKLTFDLLKDKDFASPRASSYESILETRTFADNPYRFQVVYGELYSPALSDLTGAILPWHVWNDDAWKKEAIAKGRGPKDVGVPEESYNVKRFLAAQERDFRLRPSSMGSMVLEPLNGETTPLWKLTYQVRLRRNEFFWDRKPEFKFIDYYIFDPAFGAETVEFAFNTGSIDVYAAKAFQVRRYEEMTDRCYVLKRQPNQYEYMGINCGKEHLKDKRVRLALSMAIDVDAIIDKIIYGQGSRITGPAYPVLPWYNRDYKFKHTWLTKNKKGERSKPGETFPEGERLEEALPAIPFDLQEAKALLIAAGCKDEGGRLTKDGNPFKIMLVSTSGTGSRRDTAILAKEQWQRLGVEVDYQEYEWNTYLTQYVRARNFDVCVLGWSGGLDFDSRQLWHSSQVNPPGLNFAKYSNPEADRLMEKILTVYDPDEQKRISHQIFDIIAADFPYIFLFSPYSTSVLDKHIVWRKQVGVDARGNPVCEDRPINHEFLRTARAPIGYFMKELLRRETIPQFTDKQMKD